MNMRNYHISLGKFTLGSISKRLVSGNQKIYSVRENSEIFGVSKKSSNFHPKCIKIHEEIHFIHRKCSKFSAAGM